MTTARNAVAALGCLLLLAGCPGPPAAKKTAEVVDKTPLSQPVSINLNFLGVDGETDPTPDFKGKADSEALEEYPVRFPVANMAQYTKIDPAKDKLRFFFMAIWGPYKAESRLLTLEPGKRGSVEFKLEGAKLRIEPKLIKPDKGIYNLTLTLDNGEVAGKFRVEGWGEHVPVSGACEDFPAKQVYNDPSRRLTGYVVRNIADYKHEKHGLIFMGEGYSTGETWTLPPWAKYKRIFPEMDVQIYPECWFGLQDLVSSCLKIKSAPFGSSEALYGDSFGGTSGLARCYS